MRAGSDVICWYLYLGSHVLEHPCRPRFGEVIPKAVPCPARGASVAQGGAVGSAADQSFDFEEELPDQASATQRARHSRELTNKVLDDALKHMKSCEY